MPEARVTCVRIIPDDQVLVYGADWAIEIRRDYSANTEYVKVMDTLNETHIAVRPKDWPALKEAIDAMIEECRSKDGS
jgi:hypothetical protein